jgi:hypothetical protein
VVIIIALYIKDTTLICGLINVNAGKVFNMPVYIDKGGYTNEN